MASKSSLEEEPTASVTVSVMLAAARLALVQQLDEAIAREERRARRRRRHA